jgi:hypothetical protein
MQLKSIEGGYMKITKLHTRRKSAGKKAMLEDMRYLQRKITGRSVYSNMKAVYRRVPKHRNRAYSTDFNALRGN